MGGFVGEKGERGDVWVVRDVTGLVGTACSINQNHFQFPLHYYCQEWNKVENRRS